MFMRVCACAYLLHICVRAIVACLRYLIMSTSMVILSCLSCLAFVCQWLYLFIYVCEWVMCYLISGRFVSPCPPLVCCPRIPRVSCPIRRRFSIHYIICLQEAFIHFIRNIVCDTYIYIYFYTWVVCVCLSVCLCAHACVYMIPGIRYNYCIISLIYYLIF